MVRAAGDGVQAVYLAVEFGGGGPGGWLGHDLDSSRVRDRGRLAHRVAFGGRAH